ncbi:hypothetical protein ACTU45_04830 [Streptomyces sp. 24-1644]|uniref:hypothetical protein n=1 Tax=Streptomyces sp. 24-1644 TaxID=3457315 RepID=UPI003FA74078
MNFAPHWVQGGAGFALGCLLLLRALRLCLALLPLELVLLLFAGVDGFAAGVTDRVQKGLHVIAPEAKEHRAGRTMLAQVVQPGRDDRDPPVVEVVAAALPLSRPQMPGELSQTRDDEIGVTLTDTVEHQQHGRVRHIPVPARRHRPAGAPHRTLLAIGVLHLPRKNRAYFSSLSASSSGVSWQLSTSMNSSGTPCCGAVRTMSAWALPLPAVFHVPVAGSGTSV